MRDRGVGVGDSLLVSSDDEGFLKRDSDAREEGASEAGLR